MSISARSPCIACQAPPPSTCIKRRSVCRWAAFHTHERKRTDARFHRCKGCQVGRSCGASPPFPFPSSSPLRCNSAAPQTHLKTPFPPHAPTRTSTQARLHASALAKATLFHAAANTLSPVSQLGSGTVATGGALLGNGRAGGRMRRSASSCSTLSGLSGPTTRARTCAPALYTRRGRWPAV
jgi:hypothetical protein